MALEAASAAVIAVVVLLSLPALVRAYRSAWFHWEFFRNAWRFIVAAARRYELGGRARGHWEARDPKRRSR